MTAGGCGWRAEVWLADASTALTGLRRYSDSYARDAIAIDIEDLEGRARRTATPFERAHRCARASRQRRRYVVAPPPRRAQGAYAELAAPADSLMKARRPSTKPTAKIKRSR